MQASLFSYSPRSASNSPLVNIVPLVIALLPAAARATPVLEIRRTGSNVELKWPAADTRWQLQSTASVTQGPWSSITQSPTLVSGHHVLLQSIQSTPRFFRLACAGIDEPDAGFIDSNCDGIDGDAAQAVFVVATGGSDLNPGTRAAPMATLQAAMQRATSHGKRAVYAGKGTYIVNGTLHLTNGISFYGQYSPADNWTRSSLHETRILAGKTAVAAINVSLETHVEGFAIMAANATLPGESSYGVRLQSSSGVVLRYNNIEAGTGAAGSPGTDFPAALGGTDGVDGPDGDPDDDAETIPGGPGGQSPAGNTGGKGGNGGKSPGFQGEPGAPGTAGGADGGPGGSAGNPGTAGGNGTSAPSGANGTNGTGGAAFGGHAASLYLPADGTRGTDGVDGKGGGGGGGGGGQECTFCQEGSGNAGGGGGGGGSGGDGGTGGRGGGGSFGIYVDQSNAVITGNFILTKSGGNGGKGGNGGLGGSGGEGGEGGNASITQIGRGGDGGRGGRGGHAGSGGGGGGGPSIGLMIIGSTVTHGLNSYTSGTGGTGGAGGFNTNSAAPAGLNGLSATIR
jgi:hypothetical protein